MQLECLVTSFPKIFEYSIPETILLLGGEVDSFLHPAVDTVNTFGPCGVFNSDLPPLPTPR